MAERSRVRPRAGNGQVRFGWRVARPVAASTATRARARAKRKEQDQEQEQEHHQQQQEHEQHHHHHHHQQQRTASDSDSEYSARLRADDSAATLLWLEARIWTDRPVLTSSRQPYSSSPHTTASTPEPRLPPSCCPPPAGRSQNFATRPGPSIRSAVEDGAPF